MEGANGKQALNSAERKAPGLVKVLEMDEAGKSACQPRVLGRMETAIIVKHRNQLTAGFMPPVPPGTTEPIEPGFLISIFSLKKRFK